MRIFLDANILFSAADEKSATHRLLLLVTEKERAFTSPHAWEEARRNLENKRAHFLQGLEQLRCHVDLTHAFDSRALDLNIEEKDVPILAGAITSGCTHLWTSDKTHFGHLYGQTMQGVKVVSSLQLLDLVSKAKIS